jgi:hypothetical protein
MQELDMLLPAGLKFIRDTCSVGIVHVFATGLGVPAAVVFDTTLIDVKASVF